MYFKRKPNRLDRRVYKDPHRFHITICTEGKVDIFTEDTIVEKMISELKAVADQMKWDVHAYCFEPNHLHLLVEPTEYDLDLVKFVSLFKQLSGYWYKQKYGVKLWQKSFDDHVLRSDEATEKVARYIFENPAKDGLVKNWRDYPYLGSFTYNLDDL
ncbi:MAG: transposase [Candidatus Uhrbacteria bacterium]